MCVFLPAVQKVAPLPLLLLNYSLLFALSSLPSGLMHCWATAVAAAAAVHFLYNCCTTTTVQRARERTVRVLAGGLVAQGKEQRSSRTLTHKLTDNGAAEQLKIENVTRKRHAGDVRYARGAIVVLCR